MALEIRLAYDEIEKVKELFIEYMSALDTDLSFQNFNDELDNLPGKYILPYGRLYLATYNKELAGCIALRSLDKGRCEIKRLYVRAQFRGLRIGYTLVETIISDAVDMHYNKMVLDSLPSMDSAVALYKKMGFYEIEPYCYNPVAGTVFLQKDLRKS